MTETFARPGVFGFLVSSLNHMYLGTAGDVDQAIDELVEELNHGKALNYPLQQDWNKYGEGEIDITILEEVEDATPELLKRRLDAWLTLIPYAEKI